MIFVEFKAWLPVFESNDLSRPSIWQTSSLVVLNCDQRLMSLFFCPWLSLAYWSHVLDANDKLLCGNYAILLIVISVTDCLLLHIDVERFYYVCFAIRLVVTAISIGIVRVLCNFAPHYDEIKTYIQQTVIILSTNIFSSTINFTVSQVLLIHFRDWKRAALGYARISLIMNISCGFLLLEFFRVRKTSLMAWFKMFAVLNVLISIVGIVLHIRACYLFGYPGEDLLELMIVSLIASSLVWKRMAHETPFIDWRSIIRDFQLF